MDIFEDATASAVLDMPGVTKDRLKIEAEREALVVEGEAAINVPNGIEPASPGPLDVTAAASR